MRRPRGALLTRGCAGGSLLALLVCLGACGAAPAGPACETLARDRAQLEELVDEIYTKELHVDELPPTDCNRVCKRDMRRAIARDLRASCRKAAPSHRPKADVLRDYAD